MTFGPIGKVKSQQALETINTDAGNVSNSPSILEKPPGKKKNASVEPRTEEVG